MIWVKLGVEVVSWSAWLWQHRQEFEPVLARIDAIGSFAQAAIANPAADVGLTFLTTCFTEQSQKLTIALHNANERAWRALGVKTLRLPPGRALSSPASPPPAVA